MDYKGEFKMKISSLIVVMCFFTSCHLSPETVEKIVYVDRPVPTAPSPTAPTTTNPVPDPSGNGGTCVTTDTPPTTNGNSGGAIGIHQAGWVTPIGPNHHSVTITAQGTSSCFACHQAGINTTSLAISEIRDNATFCINCHTASVTTCTGGGTPNPTPTPTPNPTPTPDPIPFSHPSGWMSERSSNHHKNTVSQTGAQQCLMCHNYDNQDMTGASNRDIRRGLNFCQRCH